MLYYLKYSVKKIALPLILIFLAAFFITLESKKDHKDQQTVFQDKRNGVAVIITGAAARIPQEAALLEEKEQYILTSEWAKSHDPVPLGDFLLPYILKED
jgi:hypothetical protein